LTFFLKRARELRIIKLREENSPKWTKVQCQIGKTQNNQLLLRKELQPPYAHGNSSTQ
jgi:hypothetical protein